MNEWSEKIKQGESRKVEFREKLPHGKQIAQTAVAFTNGAGGNILLGVNSSGKLIGMPYCPPIVFAIFNRPKPTRRVFERIRETRPAKVYLIAEQMKKLLNEEVQK